jgi:hypothetical protein
VDTSDGSQLSYEGPGPVPIAQSGTLRPDAADDWTQLRLEVWPGPEGELNGDALDPNATEPLAVARMDRNGRHVSGALTLSPLPNRQFYYVAVTGVGADGARRQLAWPDVFVWQWRGTVLEWIEASVR